MDQAKLEQFMGQAVGDLGATISGLMVYLGDRLGLYKAMAGAGPLSAADVAKRAGCDERYVREWLNNQAAGGYVAYDPGSGSYELPEEQALALADDDSPMFLPGGYVSIASCFADADLFADAFVSGRGVDWGEHDPRLFRGVERFFRPGYQAHLVASWIPALNGVEDKLRRGARVADVGCGHGASTILLAQAYPESTFTGFDFHEASVTAARTAAETAGVSGRVSFEVAGAKNFPGQGYDLVAFFDCLHDMGDPLGALSHTLGTLAPEGTVMLVEPYAGDHVEDNLNPVGRAFYGFSTVICTMASKAQEVGLALGAQAGQAALAKLFAEAGFSQFRRATETPFNLVLEARP